MFLLAFRTAHPGVQLSGGEEGGHSFTHLWGVWVCIWPKLSHLDVLARFNCLGEYGYASGQN